MERGIMNPGKTTFALFFGNRGFFPGEGILKARLQMKEAVEKAGCDALLMDESLTHFGAAESLAEGEKFAAFLKVNEDVYDGVIVCLPNFGDENGALAALKFCRKPIFIQAFEDSLDKMAPDERCDAFCGKLAMMDALTQSGKKFTIFKPHVLNPDRPQFIGQLKDFAAICRIVRGMSNVNIGAIGARTTAFKSVRCDELTLQKFGINVETIDLSTVINLVKTFSDVPRVRGKLESLRKYTNFGCVSDEKAETIAKLELVVEDLIADYRLDSIAIRCWSEIQQQLGVSPCVVICRLNDRGIAAACELDISSAVMLRMLSLASQEASCCMDWNNNYGTESEKCILFHCGPVANSMLKAKGTLQPHAVLGKSYDHENCVGVNIGEMAQFDFTYSGLKTQDGVISIYIGEGELTDDPVDKEFFGVHSVALVPRLQDVLYHIGKNGYRHHVCLSKGRFSAAVMEAAVNYLGYKAVIL